MGVARVIKEYYKDPTTDDERWVAVDIEPVEALKKPVTLKMIKEDSFLQDMALVKQSRLSVMPVKREEFDRIIELGSEG